MSADAFIREVARMLDKGPMPDWAKLPADEAELLRLLAKVNREPLEADSTSPYGVYLASPAWRWRRSVVLVLARGLCARCGEAADQVHHQTYIRKGRELLRDLLPLCDHCHGLEHGVQEEVQRIERLRRRPKQEPKTPPRGRYLGPWPGPPKA